MVPIDTRQFAIILSKNISFQMINLSEMDLIVWGRMDVNFPYLVWMLPKLHLVMVSL